MHKIKKRRRENQTRRSKYKRKLYDKNTYDFQQLEAVRSFGERICSQKAGIVEAAEY